MTLWPFRKRRCSQCISYKSELGKLYVKFLKLERRLVDLEDCITRTPLFTILETSTDSPDSGAWKYRLTLKRFLGIGRMDVASDPPLWETVDEIEGDVPAHVLQESSDPGRLMLDVSECAFNLMDESMARLLRSTHWTLDYDPFNPYSFYNEAGWGAKFYDIRRRRTV